MLVFITPKLFDIKGKREKRVPYSYRSRATIPSANIEDSRTTHDINTVKPNDVVVLGKKHSKNDCDYLRICSRLKIVFDEKHCHCGIVEGVILQHKLIKCKHFASVNLQKHSGNSEK